MAKISLSYPDSWLTISISVKNRDSWVEVSTWEMIEVWTTKVYTYDFTEVVNTDYVYTATTTWYNSMSGVIYRDWGWLTSEQATQLFNASNRPASIVSSNKTLFKDLERKVEETKDSIINKIDKIPEPREIDLSLIWIAKEQIINTIKASENEITSDIVRKTNELKEDNVSTRQLVRQKTKKIDENVSKLADRQDKTDKMIESEAEEIESEIEKILEQEADMIEKDMEDQFNKEADEIESNQPANGN